MAVLKVAYSGLGFLLGIILTRALGPTDYGAYTYAMSWAVLIAGPATLGFDIFIVRRVAAFRELDDWASVAGLLRTANRKTLIASCTLAAGAAGIALALARGADPRVLETILVALLMLPILTVMRIRQAALSGLHRVVSGQWPELLVHPLLLGTLLVLAWFARGRVSSAEAMAMTVASSLLVLGIGAWLLRLNIPEHARALPPVRVALPWRASLVPLMLMGTIQIVQSQADILLLGVLAGPRAVGIYGAATRGAQLTSFFLAAALPVIAPAIARFHAIGDTAGLETLAVKTARSTLLLSLPAALVLVFFSRWCLLLFGPGFAEGATALRILVLGQLVNVACGPVGIIMMMTGQETAAARSVAVAAMVNILLGVILVPLIGLNGAAVGSATSMILWNLLLTVEVRRRVGVHCSVFGKIGPGNSIGTA